MGARGPVPGRSDQSRHHGAKSEAPEKPEMVFRPVVQPEGDPLWHSMAADWYRSLAESGQAVFYQPSDWATARIWAEVMHRQLSGGRISAQMIAAWASAAGELLTTEGSRRRARLELARNDADPDEDAAVISMAGYLADLEA